MIHVLSIERPVGVGITNPFIALLEKEGELFYAYIKLKNNPDGVLCLINELISYHLAIAIGLPVPESGIAVIDSNTIDNSGAASLNANFDSKESCFYSRLIDKAYKLNSNIMSRIENHDIFDSIILFDHLIYNKDRNPGNILVRSKYKKAILYIIDHSHVFKNQALWDANCLYTGMADNDYRDVDIMNINRQSYSLLLQNRRISQDRLLEVAEDFTEKYKRVVIREAIDALPKDWPIESRNLEALEEYLDYRSNNLKNMCAMIVQVAEGWRNE